MNRSITRTATCAVIGAALLAPAAAQAAPPKKLTAGVGPGFTITLKNAAGKKVTSLKAGAYTIVVVDRASNHNFHLIGRGVDKKTGLAFKGTLNGARAWKVTFRKGTYRYVCDPHALAMKGSFRVV